MYRFLVKPDDTCHTCALPSYNGEGASRDYLAPNSVVECCDCHRRWVWAYSSEDDNGYSDGWGWQRPSWWRPKHRTARRLLSGWRPNDNGDTSAPGSAL